MENENQLIDLGYSRWLSSAPSGEEVVISGLSGQYPESASVSEFAENLFNKVDMLTDDTRRWDHTHPEIPKRTGKVPFAEKFDAGFFGLNYTRATSADPAIRKSLEIVVEAIFDAGINLMDMEGSNIGVFIGTSVPESSNYWFFKNTKPGYTPIIGNSPAMLAHEISYFLRLQGPTNVTDTACSSSLTAVEHAYKAIRNRSCDKAIVLGTNFCLQANYTLDFFRLGVLSTDGIIKPFDQDGHGYVRSEVVTACILERATDAKRIYCSVVHAKTNCDGFKNTGIASPSAEMQSQLLKEIYTECQVKAADLSFMEAHAAGTKVGDPAELRALDNVLLEGRNRPLLIGSLKSNIGHTETGSGLASLSKIRNILGHIKYTFWPLTYVIHIKQNYCTSVIIAMETGYIPPNINYDKPRRECKALIEGKLKVVTTKQKFQDNNGLVGINNFGFGGANCHLVLRHNLKEKVNQGSIPDNSPRMVCVSGRTEEAVKNLLDSVAKTKDVEYMRLLQNTYEKRIKGHHYRGSVLLNRNGEIARSCIFSDLTKKHTYVVFAELKVTLSLFKELSSIAVFADTINRIQDVSEYKLDVKEMVEKNGTGTFLTHNLVAVLTQIGVIEVLKSINFQAKGFFCNHHVPVLEEFICAYYDGTANLKETVDSAYSALLAQSKQDAAIHVDSIANNVKSLNKDLLSNTIVKEQSLSKQNTQIKAIIKIQRKSIILQIGEISNEVSNALARKKCRIFTVTSGMIEFLVAIGGLYEAGHDLTIHNLFPTVEFPVSRGTPMISPEIKWNHNRDWFVARYTMTDSSDQKEFGIALGEKDWAFVAGHAVDGRVLFPATGYLYLVWETLAVQMQMAKESMVVVFENCKFKRACAIANDTAKLGLKVMIQRVSGKFEVQEEDTAVVTGRVYVPKTPVEDRKLLKISADGFDSENIHLSNSDVYRELTLRGYYYSGAFKGVQDYDSRNHIGKVKWNDNWVAFMDNMLQVFLLKSDTRLLCVPTGIERVYINGPLHQEIVGLSPDKNITTYVLNECEVLRAGGIEFNGLHASVIPRKRNTAVPVLEEYKFVPNVATLTVAESVRVNMQILLENAHEIKIKAVEVIDEVVGEALQPLAPLISVVLLDIPLIKSDITILTKRTMEFDNVNVENRSLYTETECSLVIGTKFLEKPSMLSIAWESLKFNGFILSREELTVNLNNIDKDITVLTEHRLATEKLVFFRKSVKKENYRIIKISSADDSFTWLSHVQAVVRNDTKAIIYAQNDPQNGIIGLANCIRAEANREKIKAFFIVDPAPQFDPSIPFYRNQIEKHMSINIYMNGVWGTYRHLLLETSVERPAEHCYVNAMNRGDLSSVRWIEGCLTGDFETDPDKTLVHIYYASLNFKDVMMASGKISVDVVSDERRQQECVQGLEFSGRNKEGHRTMGLAVSGASATMIVADSFLTWNVPNHWTLEDAATVPLVYGTCLYALKQRARLQPGEFVLIHSGSGGVGQAAITLALAWGCTVYTTVGTKEKRKYLLNRFRKLSERNIGNSRDTSFEALVMKQTNGRGVDVVLNSLADEKLLASIRCLAVGGRFIEIGKHDLAVNNLLNLGYLPKEATFYGVTFDQLFRASTTKKAELFSLLQDGLDSGIVQPLPRIVLKDKEIEKAFRYMSLGKHTGKIVVKLRDEEDCRVAKPQRRKHLGLARYFCDQQKSYIICGGLGGFGLELADWLVLRGCRNILLTSRKGISTGYQVYRINVWRNYGCNVNISTQNISTKSGIEALISEAEQLGSVGGIFNLAVVLQDGILENQTVDSFKSSFRAKAYATQYLDEVTRKRCPKLKDFVVFSSVSCGRGSVGQTNYGMANSIMERICEKRRREGYPALAIEWGAVGDVGLVAQMALENIELAIGGTMQQRIANCLEVLDVFLTQNKATIVSSMVIAEKKIEGAAGDAISAVANIIGIADLKTISFQSTLAEIGMDSMSAVEIKHTLEREFDIFLTAQDIKNLTFFRLKEMQVEKESHEERDTQNAKYSRR